LHFFRKVSYGWFDVLSPPGPPDNFSSKTGVFLTKHPYFSGSESNPTGGPLGAYVHKSMRFCINLCALENPPRQISSKRRPRQTLHNLSYHCGITVKSTTFRLEALFSIAFRLKRRVKVEPGTCFLRAGRHRRSLRTVRLKNNFAHTVHLEVGFARTV